MLRAGSSVFLTAVPWGGCALSPLRRRTRGGRGPQAAPLCPVRPATHRLLVFPSSRACVGDDAILLYR